MKTPSRYFRAGVGAVLADPKGRVLIFERADVRGAWQFPQGGLKRKEKPLAAAYREIKEETGFGRRSLELLAQYPTLLAYELPRRMQSHKTGMGQVQYWFLFRVKGAAADVQFTKHSEFRAAAAVPFRKAVAGAPAFRQPLYQQLQDEFADLIAQPPHA